MTDQRFNELLDRYISHTASIEEQMELQAWYDSRNDIKEVQWAADSPAEETLLKNRLYEQISKRTLELKPKQLKLWKRVGVAAAMVLIIGSALILYTNQGKDAQSVYLNDVAPGKYAATLTLSNGKQIRVGDVQAGSLAKDAGVSISKSANGELTYSLNDNILGGPNAVNTFATAKGETYQVKLSDGSLIRLNADSRISFSPSFKGKDKRLVTLSGEAYFEVAKDKAHPFVVQAKGQLVEVLGTHFNINSYDNETVAKTTLLEGSVKISASYGGGGILKPGQQASTTDNGKLEIEDTDTELATAWKDNKFMFDGDPIEHIMRMVERWYNVQVIYVGEKPTETFVGGVSRFDNVSKVLRMLESAGGVHFKVEDKRIYVSK